MSKNNMENNIPTFVVIESNLLLDNNLTNTDKLLYGIICALSNNKEMACFASNEYICRLIHLRKRQLQYCLEKLLMYNYIVIEFKRNRRHIKPTVNKFLQQRQRMNEHNELFDYNWLEDEKEVR